jgi:hypothetical protein
MQEGWSLSAIHFKKKMKAMLPLDFFQVGKLIKKKPRNNDEFTIAHGDWVEAILESGVYVRKGKWTQKVSHPANFDLENDDMGAENTYFWDVY